MRFVNAVKTGAFWTIFISIFSLIVLAVLRFVDFFDTSTPILSVSLGVGVFCGGCLFLLALLAGPSSDTEPSGGAAVTGAAADISDLDRELIEDAIFHSSTSVMMQPSLAQDSRMLSLSILDGFMHAAEKHKDKHSGTADEISERFFQKYGKIAAQEVMRMASIHAQISGKV